MKVFEAYRRVRDGLSAVIDSAAGIADHYLERGVEQVQSFTPASVPVHEETRIPAARYAGREVLPSASVLTVGPYNEGLASRVVRIGAERCNVNRNPLPCPKAGRRKLRK